MTGPIVYLYRCFDLDGQLLYVGITDNVDRRKKEHSKDKHWWRDVSRVTRMAFQTRTEALWAEWAVISTCNPIYNGVIAVPVLPAVLPPLPEAVSSSTETTLSPRLAPAKRRRTKTTPVPSSRPAMTDAEAVQKMLAETSNPDSHWPQTQVRRLTGAGFGRIPRLVEMWRTAARDGTSRTDPETPR